MKKAPQTIDFKTATHEELDEYGMQLLVWDAPQLSVVLRGHLLIEQVLEALISQKMPHPDRLFEKQRLSFEMKCDLANAMGVLPGAHLGAAKALNSIRNAYAHRADHAVSVEQLNSLKIEWADIQNEAYAAACAKGTDEAIRLAIIFLNWSFLRLLHPTGADHGA